MGSKKIKTGFKPQLVVPFLLIAFFVWILALAFGTELWAQGTPPKPVQLISCDSSHVEINLPDYRLKYDRVTTNGFLLIIPRGDSAGALAMAFLPENSFHLLQPQILKSIEAENTVDSLVVTFTSQKPWATFTSQLILYQANPNLIHWVTTIHLLDWHPISSFDRDVQFYKRDANSPLQPVVTSYADQDGYAAGVTYLYEKNFLQSTVLYFQDFTPSNAYFQWIHASPRNTVGHSDRDFGYALPTSTANLKKGNDYVLSSAYLVLQPNEPQTENDMALRFLTGLSAIYKHIAKPPLVQHNWDDMAQHALQDLSNSKCWVTLNGQDFLRAYVDIPRLTSAENIAQLDVLVGLYTYEKSTGFASPLKSRLEGNLIFFYNTEHQQIVNDYPNEGISRGDSWYTIELAIGLSRLAGMGSSVANMLLFQSLPSIIQFAHTVDYDFPVFFSYDTFQKISGSEPDVAGGYAYLMLKAYDLKPDSLYLHEAQKSIAHIAGKKLHLSYELQMTGAAAAACARLYRLTGESRYATLSYLPLANLLRHTWLWECNYGSAANYSTFFGLSPMPHADVITMKEQYETWQYIREYLSLMKNDVAPDMVAILRGFVRYTPNVLFYTLPPNLPQEALWIKTAAYGSTNDNALYIPYEDLRDGWQKSGQIGQEIYGAGGVLCLAAGLKTKVAEKEGKKTPDSFALLQNYPNPFSEKTKIFLTEQLRGNWKKRHVVLKIFNLLGQEIWHDSIQPRTGKGLAVTWNGKNDQGQNLPPGIYFAVLKSGTQIATRKMVLLK